MEGFEHIRPMYRAKVAQDYLGHLDTQGQWDWAKFNPSNDYQRHLYALFLWHTGATLEEVGRAIYRLAEDVSGARRVRYTSEVLHSEIVGFPLKDGSTLLMPSQEVVKAEFPSLAGG